MDDWPSPQNSSKRIHDQTWSRDDGPSPQNSSKRIHDQTWSRDDGPSRQNSSKKTHEETLKKLEVNIRRLSSDVKKLYHDVSSLSNACNEPKPSRRKLFESMEAVIHHIGNLSIDEFNLNENVRDLTRNVCARPKMFDFQEELERKINKKMRNDDFDSFKTTPAQESNELLTKINNISKHLFESSKCDPLQRLQSAPDITKRRNTYSFLNDTVSKGLLSKVKRFSRHSSESSISEPPLPAPDEKKRRKTYPFENDAANRVLLQLSQSLFCNTTKEEFGQRRSSEMFGCRSIDYYPVLRSLSVYSVTKVDISPSFSTFEQFKADKLGRCTLRWVAPLTDKRRSSFNRFNQLTADKLNYDRYSLQWEGPPSNKRPSSFRDFVHKSAVLDKCGNVVSGSSYESGVIKRLLTQLDVGTSSCHPVPPPLFVRKSGVLDKCGNVESGSSYESGALKRMLKKLDDVGTSSCHPVSPTQFVQHCSRPSEMINRHINSLNNKTVLIPLQQLEISYDRDVDFLYPLDNNLITAIMRTRSCQSLRSRTSCRKSISQQYPPKYTPNHTQCFPPVWPLECLTANSPPNLICPPKYPPLESRSWPWVGQMTRSCSNVNDTEIRCLCGCGQEDACLDPEVQNTPARLVEDCAGRDCAEWSDYEWEWLIPPSLRGFSAYDILVGSIMMLALIPLTKYDVVSDRYLILLLFLILTYRHY